MRDKNLSTAHVLDGSALSLLFEGQDSLPTHLGLGHAVSDDGLIALGIGYGAYQIALIKPWGEVVARAARDIAAPQRSDEEIQERERQFSAVAPPGGGVVEISRDLPQFNATSFRFDSLNRLWVRTNRGQNTGRTIFDVFSPELVLLGEVTIPEWVGWFDIGGDYLAGNVRGPLDVPSLKVWEIRP